jgi:hypothetical protein
MGFIAKPCLKTSAGHWQFKSVILATQEADTRRIKVQSQPGGKQFRRPYLENTQHNTSLAEGLKW